MPSSDPTSFARRSRRECRGFLLLVWAVAALLGGCAAPLAEAVSRFEVVVLGIAQDGGVPQAGSFADQRWGEANGQRMVACLGLIDPRTESVWMFDATPDFRRQPYDLHAEAEGPRWR